MNNALFMLLTLTLIILSLNANAFTLNESIWTQGSPSMSVALAGSVVGHSTDLNTIWILGGRTTDTNTYGNMISYSLTTQSFSTPQQLPTSITGVAPFGSSYFQDGEYIYYLDYNGNKLNRFNTDTGTHDDTYEIDINYNDIKEGTFFIGYFQGCIRATDTDIFLLRGSLTLILNRATNTWSVGPTRAVPRQEESCIFNQNKDTLYAMGGKAQSFDALDSIEILQLSNDMSTASWSVISATLTIPMSQLRTVIYGDYIITIGGWNSGYMDRMDIIDTVTNTVSYSCCLDMPYAVTWAAPLFVGNTLYNFGGYNNGQHTDGAQISWQYTTLPTFAPTTATPTSSPVTRAPTSETLAPVTQSPTTETPAPVTQSPTTETPAPSMILMDDTTSSANKLSVIFACAILLVMIDWVTI